MFYRILFRKLRISESKTSFSASLIVVLESYFLTCCSCMFRFLTLSFNVSWSSRQCTSHWKVFSIILAACTSSMVCLKNFFITNCERRGDLIVSALDSGASGPGWSSGLDIVLCFWARHFLSAPRCIIGYRILILGVTLRWTSISSRGTRNTPSHFMLLKPR